ncbi:MAG TPA: glycosyltransferase family 2 protein [Thermoanaerobaculia bacterium]|nr:glycosyltransferase family 2 protein [Thermoanaerobaculia bacterium]
MTAVSIIIPVYNRAALLREAIDSVLPAAGELDLELVVVDDASTDDTWPFIQSLDHPSIRAFRLEQNRRQSAARNRGLEEARGRYVKFFDSDDRLEPEHLRRELEAIEREQADIAVSGWYSEGAPPFDAPHFGSIVDDVLAGVAVPTSAALYVRRPDWRWDENLHVLDDWDYFCQAALGASKIVTVPGVSYVMRRHEGARVTGAVTMLSNARAHHTILSKIERRLEGEGRLTDARRKRLAQYFYKELRVLTLHDPPAARAALQHIFELDPRFRPTEEERSRAIRIAARVVGVRATLRLYKLAKRFV